MRVNTDLLGKLGLFGASLLLCTATLNGCSKDPAEDESETSDTTGDGDGDGDPATGDGDGDGDPTGDGDGDGDPTGDGDGDGDGDTPLECPTHDPGDGAANDEACQSNDECASKLCEVFQDAPPVDGTCQPAPTECRTRIMGRTLDFTTRTPVPDVNLRAAQAIQASVDPVNAAAEASATSDAEGMIDTLSDGQVMAALGLIGLTDAEGYYLTATGLAAPAEGTLYGPANDIHDIWIMPADTLSDWSTYLMPDPEFADYLPLGGMGGVIGMVRDATTGDPYAGAVVVPTAPDTSSAVIRYLNDAGDDFVSDMTTSTGVFVIVDPGLGETFDVEIGGNPQGVTGTAGSASGAIFTLVMDVTP
jgi:hypothetical protein